MANLALKESPELNLEMEALTPITPAHADRFNERFTQLLNNIKALDESKNQMKDSETEQTYRLGVENGLVYVEEVK